MPVVVSHPTGNANLRAVLRGLTRADLLQSFHTTLAIPDSALGRGLLGEALDRRLDQRRFPEVPRPSIRTHPWRELIRCTGRRFGPARLVRHETGWASVDAVYHSLDRRVAHALRRTEGSLRGIYAYEDGALESFRAGGELGLVRLYDLPIAHWRSLRRLLSEEAERLPEWTSTMEGLRDSAAKLERKDKEIGLADRIFVASSFTRSSLIDHFGTALPISVVPYGFPPPQVATPSARRQGEPLQILYAGHLSQRKGIADLIAALERSAVDWRLTLAGPRPAQAPAALDRFLADPRCSWLGTVPHATLLQAMTAAHLFVFPSIVEGFGLVLAEAMAAGLPVITTPNTAGPDIMTDGEEGFIVPIRAPDMLAQRIAQMNDSEDLRYAMAWKALQRAEASPWLHYEDALAKRVKACLPQ